MSDKKDTCDDDVLKILVMFGVQNIERGMNLNYRMAEWLQECEKVEKSGDFSLK